MISNNALGYIRLSTINNNYPKFSKENLVNQKRGETAAIAAWGLPSAGAAVSKLPEHQRPIIPAPNKLDARLTKKHAIAHKKTFR